MHQAEETEAEPTWPYEKQQGENYGQSRMIKGHISQR